MTKTPQTTAQTRKLLQVWHIEIIQSEPSALLGKLSWPWNFNLIMETWNIFIKLVWWNIQDQKGCELTHKRTCSLTCPAYVQIYCKLSYYDQVEVVIKSFIQMCCFFSVLFLCNKSRLKSYQKLPWVYACMQILNLIVESKYAPKTTSMNFQSKGKVFMSYLWQQKESELV